MSDFRDQLFGFEREIKKVNAMIDKNNQLLESDHKQGTGEEKPNVSADEDPSLLVHAEVRKGSLLGSEHIRFVRPSQPAFRRLGYGVLEATEVTEAPHGVLGRIKRLFIGEPIPPPGPTTND